MMVQIEWDKVNKLLNCEIESISKKSDLENCNKSKFEKRKIIFDYLVDNVEYDFNILNSIISNKRKTGFADELIEPMLLKKGVCNGISQEYKLLLEKIGVYSMIVSSELEYNEFEMQELQKRGVDIQYAKKVGEKFRLGHMLLLVENENGTFSFDDPTCAILNRNNRESYFNYDCKKAIENHQVNLKGFTSEYVDAVVERKSSEYQRKIEKKDIYGVIPLDNYKIASYNSKKIESQENR